MIPKINFTIILLAIVLFVSCSQRPLQIFVGPNGKPNNPGTEEAPFSNLETALEKASELKIIDENVSIEVKLLPGEYHLNKPIHITPILSGVSIIGSGVDETFVKGSKELNLKWEKFENNIWFADLEEDIELDQLFVNGKQQHLARYPNYDENGGHWQGHAEDVIAPERIKTWHNPIGGLVHITHRAE